MCKGKRLVIYSIWTMASIFVRTPRTFFNKVSEPHGNNLYFVRTPRTGNTHFVRTPRTETTHFVRTPRTETTHFVRTPRTGNAHFVRTPRTLRNIFSPNTLDKISCSVRTPRTMNKKCLYITVSLTQTVRYIQKIIIIQQSEYHGWLTDCPNTTDNYSMFCSWLI